MTTKNNDILFIFQEEEFESNVFYPSAFVAKYRKVCSLESLKEQLIQYSSNIKVQLYNIINRDYTDFISISTKLDGLDTRVQMVTKPLKEYQGDLTSLHESVFSSCQLMQEKINYRKEVSNRKLLLKNILHCIEMLSTAKQIVLSEYGEETLTGDGHDRAVHRALLLKKINQTVHRPPQKVNNRVVSGMQDSFHPMEEMEDDGSFFSETDVGIIECSEWERAANALHSVQHSLARLHTSGNPTKTGSEDGSRNGSRDGSARNVMKETMDSLENDFRNRKEQLVKKIEVRLVGILSEVMMTGSTSAAVDTDANVPRDEAVRSIEKGRRTAWCHCLRAMQKLECSHRAEKVFTQTVVDPLIKSFLTQGKVDGKLGRGSFSGLNESLSGSLVDQSMDQYMDPTVDGIRPSTGLLESMVSTSLSTLLALAEELRGVPSTAPGADFLIHSVWSPVLDHLSQRHPNLFSIGIPSILSRSYRAIWNFSSNLCALAGPELRPLVFARLTSHPKAIEVMGRWNLDLYHQLRCNEIFGRVDKACELIALQARCETESRSLDEKQCLGMVLWNGVQYNVLELIYDTPPPPLSDSATAKTPLVVPSIALSDLLRLVQSHLTQGAAAGSGAAAVSSSLLRVFLTEMLVCLHEEVLLPPIVNRCIGVTLKLVMRLEAHLAVALGMPTLHFGKAALDTLRTSPHPSSTTASNTMASTTSNTVASSHTTPVKPVSGATTTSTSSPATLVAANESHHSAVNMTADESAHLAFDLKKTSLWLNDHFKGYCLRQLHHTSVSSSSEATVTIDQCVGTLCSQIDSLLSVLWNAKVSTTLLNDCRRGLSAVKAIAGKYRMTNKPAPDAASQYVETILQPLRLFVDTNADLIKDVTVSLHPHAERGSIEPAIFGGKWIIQMIEDITMSYHEQVKLLMDTVKQMENALLRRSKLRTTTVSTTSSNTGLSDSEKISMQLSLDIETFINGIKSFGIGDPVNDLISVGNLKAEVLNALNT